METLERQHISIEDEMRRSYLDYAMSVIIGRALPDVRDGLKPVHRRVLWAMQELGNDYNKAYKKSARIVGDVIGKYHPHGDTAVYDTMVRMAQPFSMRYMLIDGQTGIAVGMATNIPPHNLTEIVNACLALLDDPALPLAALMQHVPGPDFPTGGIINGAQEIATAYRTGRGRLSVRARVSIEDVGKGDRQAIIVTEL